MEISNLAFLLVTATVWYNLHSRVHQTYFHESGFSFLFESRSTGQRSTISSLFSFLYSSYIPHSLRPCKPKPWRFNPTGRTINSSTICIARGDNQNFLPRLTPYGLSCVVSNNTSGLGSVRRGGGGAIPLGQTRKCNLFRRPEFGRSYSVACEGRPAGNRPRAFNNLSPSLMLSW